VAEILLIIAPNQQRAEPQRELTLGYRPAQWCRDELELDPKPIGLKERIKLFPDSREALHIFVKVDQDEDGPLKPGFYRIDTIPAKVRELLREL
jgi:hypothetical protein